MAYFKNKVDSSGVFYKSANDKGLPYQQFIN